MLVDSADKRKCLLFSVHKKGENMTVDTTRSAYLLFSSFFIRLVIIYAFGENFKQLRNPQNFNENSNSSVMISFF